MTAVRLAAVHLALDLLERGTDTEQVAHLVGLPLIEVARLRDRMRSNSAHHTARARLRDQLDQYTTGRTP